jgi:hypothetical protein
LKVIKSSEYACLGYVEPFFVLYRKASDEFEFVHNFRIINERTGVLCEPKLNKERNEIWFYGVTNVNDKTMSVVDVWNNVGNVDSHIILDFDTVKGTTVMDLLSYVNRMTLNHRGA